MDWQPQKPDSDPDFLDRLLAEAQWAEPTPETVGRLRAKWRSLMVRRKRRRRLALMLIAASILLTAVGLVSSLQSNHIAIEPQATEILAKNTVPVPQSSRQLVQIEKPQPNTTSPKYLPVDGTRKIASGLPAARQQLVAKNSSSLLAKKPVSADPPEAHSSRPPNVYERVVMVAYRRARNSRTQQPAPQSVVLAAEQSVDQPTDDEQSAALRREQLSSLLAQNDLQSVRAFLEYVQEPLTSADALDCLTSVPNPPVELLFRCLCGPSAGQRKAAALVLGRLNQPAISRELIAMIVRGTYRQEAMIALLSSSETTAQEFLADAERNPAFFGILWNAKRQFQNPLPWRS